MELNAPQCTLLALMLDRPHGEMALVGGQRGVGRALARRGLVREREDHFALTDRGIAEALDVTEPAETIAR